MTGAFACGFGVSIGPGGLHDCNLGDSAEGVRVCGNG